MKGSEGGRGEGGGGLSTMPSSYYSQSQVKGDNNDQASHRAYFPSSTTDEEDSQPVDVHVYYVTRFYKRCLKSLGGADMSYRHRNERQSLRPPLDSHTTADQDCSIF